MESVRNETVTESKGEASAWFGWCLFAWLSDAHNDKDLNIHVQPAVQLGGWRGINEKVAEGHIISREFGKKTELCINKNCVQHKRISPYIYV